MMALVHQALFAATAQAGISDLGLGSWRSGASGFAMPAARRKSMA